MELLQPGFPEADCSGCRNLEGSTCLSHPSPRSSELAAVEMEMYQASEILCSDLPSYCLCALAICQRKPPNFFGQSGGQEARDIF